MGDDELEVLEGEVVGGELVLPWLEVSAAEALLALRAAIAGLDEERARLAGAGDIDSLAVGLAGVNMLARDLRTLAQAVAADLTRLMGEQGERSITLEGVGVFERKKNVKRSGWKHDDVATRLVLDAMERGEMNHPLDVASLLLASAGVGYWRVGVLRDHGLEPADYCLEELDGYTVRHTPPGSAK